MDQDINSSIGVTLVDKAMVAAVKEAMEYRIQFTCKNVGAINYQGYSPRI